MEQPHTPTDPKPSNSFLRYGNFALQLFGGMALAGWLGYKLDQYLGFGFPVFLLSFVLIVFTGMLYTMYKKLKND
ncbi:MAG: AtpZ/AtpI family protein [Cyclobacteriaceae bacterium]|nr:AtpZ/AtpI family protein [Cyclobacteriaceae bacterium]